MESSSSERRDELEESRCGGARDRPGRGGRQVARPMTPVLHHRGLVHAEAHGSPRVRSGIYETCASLRKPTGGRPTLHRLVEMSTDGDRAARRGVHQTTDC